MKRDSRRSILAIVGFAVAAALAIGGLLPSYWVFLFTTIAITAVALQSVGLVSGRAGMMSLCQMSFAGVGAWTVAWCNVNGVPGTLLLWIVLGGLAAVPLGLAMGVPALRLRGINLAIATLGFAAAFDAVLGAVTFPGQTDFRAVARPPLFAGDRSYFVLCTLVFALVAVGLDIVSRTRVGAAWLTIRHSERAAAAHGVSVPRAKLAAFVLSAFIAAVSGGLLAGQLGTLVASNFSVVQSLVLFALGTMTGARNPEGAVFGGILSAIVPEILRRANLPQDLSTVLFSVGAVQALSTGESISDALRGTLVRRRRSRNAEPQARVAVPREAARSAPFEAAAGPALEIRDLVVRYGSVVALDGVSLQVPARSVAGLIGPNGAGKSTLIDAVTGFLGRYEGIVRVDGRALEGLQANQRARFGVRRTWQTTRIAPDLTLGAYVRLGSGRGISDAEIDELLAWLGCPGAGELVAGVDVGTRRLLDVAGAVAAKPRLILLDEPAAGQSYEESMFLAGRIAEIPARFGSAVLLVEHDIDLVRTACSTLTVIDFGRVIAAGSPAGVLAQKSVVEAYLGIAEGQAVNL